MKYKHISLLPLLASLLVGLLVYACGWPVDSGGDRPRPPQTEILNLRVQPDTVAPGDTSRFTCIIEDSTDKRFKFYWVIDAGEVIGAEKQDTDHDQYVSEENKIQWVAPNEPASYTFGVLASNGSQDSISVEESFVIVVE